jgi:hypothetical protein
MKKDTLSRVRKLLKELMENESRRMALQNGPYFTVQVVAGIPHLRDAHLIVIATEGGHTEEQYFDIFESKKVQIKVLPTEDGYSAPKHVLQRLANYKKEYQIGKDDQLWLMIDRDRWNESQLSEEALKLKKNEQSI